MSDYLIITSSGGGGHIVAANAIHHYKLKKNPENRVQQFDVMRSGCSYGTTFGTKCTDMWDEAQRKGDVEKQKRLMSLQPITEAFFFLGAFFTVLYQLLTFKTLPKKVICTQLLNLYAITLAVRLANLIRYKEERKITKLDLYVTDLPTDKATHILGSLRRLHMVSQSSFDMIRLHTPKCAQDDSDTFWKQVYLKPNQIKYESLPVSEAFSKVEDLPLPRTTVDVSILKENIKEDYNLRGQDKVGLIMLGTAPEESAILGYVDEIIKQSNEKSNFSDDKDSNAYFFVSCGKAQSGKSTNELYEKVMNKISQANLHPRLKIVPFTNQPVPLIFARSDMTITRSGGITSAEILALKERPDDQKRVLIHSPFQGIPQGSNGEPEKDKSKIQEYLIDKIPLWENGHADYLALKKNVKAQIVTPHFIGEELTQFFQSKKLSFDLIHKFEQPKPIASRVKNQSSMPSTMARS